MKRRQPTHWRRASHREIADEIAYREATLASDKHEGGYASFDAVRDAWLASELVRGTALTAKFADHAAFEHERWRNRIARLREQMTSWRGIFGQLNS